MLATGREEAAVYRRALSGASAQTQAQTPPWFHSKQTGDTFHNSRVSLTTAGWAPDTAEGCVHLVCVCVGEVFKFI